MTRNAPTDQKAIELRAYYLWQRRGAPFGSAEVDWLQAEQDMRLESRAQPAKAGAVAMAELVGSALGSVAGLMAAVSGAVNDESKKSV